MLRIAKTTPGVLDLSAVKDEHGIPVTLAGPSHRDVPDHEENNPVLRRIVELHWVTVSKVPVETPDEIAPEASSDPVSDVPPPPLDPVITTEPVPDVPPPLDPVITTEPEPPTAAAEPTPTNGNSDTRGDDQATAAAASAIDVAPSPAVKPERKSSRRP